eukprot:s4266_g4.t1
MEEANMAGSASASSGQAGGGQGGGGRGERGGGQGGSFDAFCGAQAMADNDVRHVLPLVVSLETVVSIGDLAQSMQGQAVARVLQLHRAWLVGKGEETLSSSSVEVIAAAGIVSDADLACLWMSPCGIAGDVPASALAEIVQAWRIANQCFEVQAGRSSLPGPVQLQPLVASAAKPKKRCLPPAFLLRKTCRSKVPRLVAVVVPEHERTKRDQQIQAMYDIVVATGSANLRFSPTELGTAEVMPLFVRLLDKVSDARLFDSSTGTVKAFLAWMLLFATACLRFAHLQRSGLRCEGHILAAFCKMGKRKEAGVFQQPFTWSAPACPWPDVCIAPTLLLEHGELCVAKPDTPFIVPDLQLQKSGRLEPGTPKLAKKMSRAKFCDLAKSVLMAI